MANELRNAINTTSKEQTFRYSNETYSGCDMVASININNNIYNPETKRMEVVQYSKIIGELTTISYSIHMEKKPIRSIGNVNAKDYVMGPRTIAGSLVFSVFNKHFAKDIVSSINSIHSNGEAFLVDELPPFDLTISAANEYGYRSRMAIYGIRLLNEGQVMSINDVYTENTYQFFATDIEYLNDEMSYSRDAANKMYKLKDDYIETFKYEDSRIKWNASLWGNKEKEDYENLMNRPIKLLESTKHPTRENSPGITTFVIDPPQDQGNIFITDSNNKVTTIAINSTNKTRKASISLQPDTYTAFFENSNNKKVSNTVRFSINNFYKKNNLSEYAPVIEKVTDTSISIYSNEPSHNKVKINWKGSSSSASNEYDITRRRCEIINLQSDTEFTIYTFNDSDKIPSCEVKVKTLNKIDRLYEELILFCYANSRQLIFANIKIYEELINEAKEIAINSKKEIVDSLIKVKQKYVDLFNSLGNSLPDTELKDEYNLKVKACNEIIEFASKLYNDFIEAVNIVLPVPVPKMRLNSKYENIFEFDESITTAEFYKNYGNILQFVYEVPKYNFKNIDGIENSFRYMGKPGHKHIVESLKNNVRSHRLEFYVMTQTEKDEFIKKDNLKDKLSDKNIEEINSQIQKDQVNVIETQDYKRAFMINAKKIENPKLFPPDIETINENVLLRTSVRELIFDDFLNEFYVTLATYEDILCDNPIYKVKFTCKEDVIAITRLLHGLKNNQVYATWIEDNNGTQLSNASTFVYSDNFDLEDNDMKEYELKDISENIKLIAKNTLPKDLYEDILSVIENNRSISNFNYIENILSVLLNTVTNKSQMLAFLKEFKYYLGIMENTDGAMINTIKYENGICSFNTLTEGTLLMYNIVPDDCIVYKTKALEVNKINTSVYQDLILLIVVDKDLKKKSNLIVINKKENFMEVL